MTYTPLLVSESFSKVEIQSDLLYELMTQGHGLSKTFGFPGWPCVNVAEVATYGVLTWLTMRSLGVERYPWHPDARFTILPSGTDAVRVARLVSVFKSNPRLLDDACDDLKRVYAHTQSELSRLGRPTLTLSRSFADESFRNGANNHDGFASRLLTMQKAAIQLNRDSFDIPLRLLSSWGAGGYGRGVVDVTLDLPARDIGWGNATIASRDSSRRDAIERGEWVVLNRAMDGIATVPVTAITYSKIDPATINSFSDKDAADYLAGEAARLDVNRSTCAEGSHRKGRLTMRHRLRAVLDAAFLGR